MISVKAFYYLQSIFEDPEPQLINLTYVFIFLTVRYLCLKTNANILDNNLHYLSAVEHLETCSIIVSSTISFVIMLSFSAFSINISI